MPSWKLVTLIIIISLAASPFGLVPMSVNEENEQEQQIGLENAKEIEHNLASMPGWFTENQGQIENAEVKFVFSASDVSIGFIESGYLLKMTNEDNRTSVVKVSFEGANPVAPVGRGELSHKNNYFRGNDSSKWRTGVSNFNEIIYENLYEGIDLVFYTNKDGLKYDFIIAPGADPSQISWSYDNTAAARVDAAGRLLISTASGSFMEEVPFSYQWSNEKKVNVPSNFMCNQNTVQFEVGKYDPYAPLFIDPLIFSTVIGGSGREWGRSIALDSNEDIYITGQTESTDFPTTPGCYDSSGDGHGTEGGDIYVCKLNSDGSELLY